MKQQEKKIKERVLYQYRPVMARETIANIKTLFPIFVILGIIVIVGSIWLMIYGFCEETETEYLIVGGSLIFSMVTLLWLCKYFQHYLENAMIFFYDEKICIKKYRKEDVVISYDEVKKCIKKKQIQVRNGGLVIPYSKGRFRVVVGKTVLPESFLGFIAGKCAIKIPGGEKTVLAIIKNGYGRSWYGVGGVCFIGFSLFVSIFATIGDFGLEHSGQEIIRYFINILFAKKNFFTIIGAICVIIGVILKAVYYFLAKKIFKEYNDIKVRFF